MLTFTLLFLEDDILELITKNLLYDSNLSQVFKIKDGLILDNECTLAYYTETVEVTDRMKTLINDVITSQLCGNDTASVVAKTQTFFGFETQV